MQAISFQLFHAVIDRYTDCFPNVYLKLLYIIEEILAFFVRSVISTISKICCRVEADQWSSQCNLYHLIYVRDMNVKIAIESLSRNVCVVHKHSNSHPITSPEDLPYICPRNHIDNKSSLFSRHNEICSFVRHTGLAFHQDNISVNYIPSFISSLEPKAHKVSL